VIHINVEGVIAKRSNQRCATCTPMERGEESKAEWTLRKEIRHKICGVLSVKNCTNVTL
jgi:hypothetical protein